MTVQLPEGLVLNKLHTVTSDIDGTLAKTDEAMVKRYAEVNHLTYQKAYDEFLVKTDYEGRGPFIDKYIDDDPDFWLNLPTYPKDIQALINFRSHTFYSVERLYFVTARPDRLRPLTEQWIDKHFGILGYDGILMNTRGEKGVACEYVGAQIHFEDHFKEAKLVAKAGIYVGMIDQPYNVQYRDKNKDYMDKVFWIDSIADLGGPFA